VAEAVAAAALVTTAVWASAEVTTAPSRGAASPPPPLAAAAVATADANPAAEAPGHSPFPPPSLRDAQHGRWSRWMGRPLTMSCSDQRIGTKKLQCMYMNKRSITAAYGATLLSWNGGTLVSVLLC